MRWYGAYHKTRTTKTDYFVKKSGGGELKAQIAHQNEIGEYYYRERDRGNDHNDVIVPTSYIYTAERYYRHNKSIASLRRLIVRAKQANELANSSDELEKTPIIQPHGNSKTVSDVERPYIGTSKEACTNTKKWRY